MNILIVSNTFFQLYLAIHMKNTLFQADCVDIVVTNEMGNALPIAEKLKELKLFDKVYYRETKCCLKENLNQRLSYISQVLCGADNREEICKKSYDLFLVYNFGRFIHGLFARLIEKNPEIECAKYEEGILSYDEIEKERKAIRIAFALRKALGKKNLPEVIKKFYCVYPEVYKGKREPMQIPCVDFKRDQTSQQFSSLFDVKIGKEEYSPKYIFFASVFDFEGGQPIGELELIKKIAAVVGNENLLVKVHPRDKIDRFIQAGLNVDRNSGIPWEAIQASKDFSDHVFLTVNSGSVLSVNLTLQKIPEIHFLYPLCETSENALAKASVVNIQNLITMLHESNPKTEQIHITAALEKITET